MVHCRARKLAEHVGLWRWSIGVRVRREDDIPLFVDVVEFRGPEVCRVIHNLGWNESGLDRSIVPVAIPAISTVEVREASIGTHVKLLLWYIVMLSPFVKVR